MLFITRKTGEVIVLTDKISGENVCKILVRDIQADRSQVELGIDAPTTIKIDRDFYHGNRTNGERQNG